ncbi:TPA: hypothetical protein SLP05_001939 [Pseudomonas putida]|nr:hypothetical protein [Pseudomonas putida]
MVINIPEPGDFFQSGKELFNFAWDALSNLLTELDQADYYGFDKNEVSEKYWAGAQRTLTTSLAIVQQGVEFVLKGKIAAISPYLLISDSPSRWPSNEKGEPIDFSQFRTVDAQDLIKIHDTFSSAPLSSTFAAKFHSLRERRNTIMHSVGKGTAIQVAEVIEAVLYMHKSLFPAETWAWNRRDFLENSPDSELGGGEFAINRTCWEFSIVKDILKKSDIFDYMGIDKKQRAYLCPECLTGANTDAGFEFKLANLRPKSPSATLLYCPVCNIEHKIKREDCKAGCPGNVLSEDDTCLTCGN